MRRLFLAVLLLGAAPTRYNEPIPADKRSPLVTHIEELSRKLRPSLQVEPRLERAAAEIARRAPSSGPPPNELVAGALWLHGIVEPPPHLLVVTVGAGDDEGPLLDELRAQLPRVLSTGNYRRVGAAAEPPFGQVNGQGNVLNVVLALQESFVELEPIPRALPADGSVSLKGRILPPYVRPEVLVTAPDGKVARLFVAARADVTKLTASLHCVGVGRHQVEITGDDRFGPSVLANFPVDCGVPAPTELVAGPGRDPRTPVTDEKKAEAELARLINVDRARAGLQPLILDERLSKVARGHSEDMVRHHFVGHVSPTTGSAADRLKAAKYPAQLVLENVARAYSPGEVERGLMESPGHRANLLSTEVTHVGVGIVLGDQKGDPKGDRTSGVREIFATQLFSKAPEALPDRAADELKRRVAEYRSAHELPALRSDDALDRIAADISDELARGKLGTSAAQEPLQRALKSFSGRYKAVRTAVAITVDLPQAIESLDRPLGDKEATGMGVGVSKTGDQVYVVVLLGSR